MITCVVEYTIDHETYRARFGVDPAFIAADKIRDESGCVLRYDRSFMRPMLGNGS